MKYLLIIITAAMMYSCANYASMNSLMHAGNGVTYNEFRTETDDEVEGEFFEIELQAKKYKVLEYQIVTAIYVKRSQYTDYSDSPTMMGPNGQPRTWGTGTGTTKTRTSIENDIDKYYVVFKDDKMYYWGFLYEFKRNAVPEINDLALKIIDYKEEN